jgi:hypothetical protein
VRRDHLTPSPSLSRRERNRRPPLPQLPTVPSCSAVESNQIPRLSRCKPR